ncbi:hypothetical protein DAD186_01010 [Dermabacter vaginalis]|uniref:Uncharacterized protein n=1 Tax=Dermabacter vaginalis TaxID=1630135 RepID=A0A1B0ZFE9_9MICO|nr:hypothetical protein DAD186_01010 [Dermabacter vaginalis]
MALDLRLLYIRDVARVAGLTGLNATQPRPSLHKLGLTPAPPVGVPIATRS